jgi:hypothetical protein
VVEWLSNSCTKNLVYRWPVKAKLIHNIFNFLKNNFLMFHSSVFHKMLSGENQLHFKCKHSIGSLEVPVLHTLHN